MIADQLWVVFEGEGLVYNSYSVKSYTTIRGRICRNDGPVLQLVPRD